MFGRKKVQEVISSLLELQQTGMELPEALALVYVQENIEFDDIWPAVMKIHQLSEKEAMYLTKKYCRR